MTDNGNAKYFDVGLVDKLISQATNDLLLSQEKMASSQADERGMADWQSIINTIKVQVIQLKEIRENLTSQICDPYQ